MAKIESIFGGGDDSLKPRYLQSGSIIVAVSDPSIGDATLHTVTSGKTLYITSVTLWADGGGGASAGDNCTLEDGSAGDNVFSISVPALDTPYTISFPTPLEFKNEIYVNTQGGDNWGVSVQGWEE